MRVQLMYRDRDVATDGPFPWNEAELAADLDLPVVWAAMAGGDRFLYDVARTSCLANVDDPAAIAYRQDVLADCRAQPDVARQLYQIATDALAAERRIYGFLRQTPSGVLRRSVEALEMLVEHLRQLRRLAEDGAGAVGSEGLRAFFSMVGRELDDAYFETVADHLKRLRFRNGLWMSAGLGEGSRGAGYVLRVPGGAQKGWKERVGLAAPTSYAFEVAPRDEAGHRALGELSDRGINLVANALAQSTDHILSFFSQLRSEAGFYVGCLNLESELAARGRSLCVPEPLPPDAGAMAATDLFDVALALRTGEPVVGNDLAGDGKSLVVVTGANSGGKSTFLRSVGLAQLMMSCGMGACAGSYRASVCGGLVTHFPREEDTAMESGRFDEELSRMSTVVDHLTGNGLLLLNESFAATNEWEGSEIARQVVHALVESGTRILYVTHLFNLADSLRAEGDPAHLFLRAERAEDGRRTFKIGEGAPLSTSFGADLYEKLGGWGPPVPAAARSPR
ncbi:MAG: MutS-related protein [Acidimicrobiales bacterium]